MSMAKDTSFYIDGKARVQHGNWQVQIIAKTKLFAGHRKKIAELIVKGKREAEIARIIPTSLGNVKKHIDVMKDCTGCTSLHGLSTCLALIFMINGQLGIEVRGDQYVITKKGMKEGSK